jgi:hypothetical protein
VPFEGANLIVVVARTAGGTPHSRMRTAGVIFSFAVHPLGFTPSV